MTESLIREKLNENKNRNFKFIQNDFEIKLEIVVGYISSITFLIFVASFIEMQNWIRILLIAFGLITFAFGVYNCIKIEQTTGYYECTKCHYKYVPKYSSVLLSMHINRTRYMKCPKCNEKSWHKKVISKS